MFACRTNLMFTLMDTGNIRENTPTTLLNKLSADCQTEDEDASKETFDEEEKYQMTKEIRSQTILHWNYRRLSLLPEELIQEGGHIRQIYLKRNLLCTLPESIGALSQLTYLYLHGNKLQALPEAIELCSLKGLSVLMLSGNNLRSLPDAVQGLTGLQGLYLDHNQLTELPRTLAGLPLLTRLSCCANNLLSLPALPFMATPAIFFDDNHDLNYLPFSLVQQLRVGESWDPVTLQTCGCFQEQSIINQTVFVRMKEKQVHGEEIHIVIGKWLHHISSVLEEMSVVPLSELCIRYIWNQQHGHLSSGSPCNTDQHKAKYGRSARRITSEYLPPSLCNPINFGPTAYCGNETCLKPVFTYSSVIFIKIDIVSRLQTDRKTIPCAVYFCCDTCCKAHTSRIQHMVDDFSLWLSERFRNCCQFKVL
ncbi:uncharacterized protein LOC143027239 isoform X2 [Oratosquilla oratoria]|uniref:uncharacterized protein LOC143027239 isoform X2 n=1 Tax=Oratosquilla oratoria TaxID=337810 RepID=UPI003F75CA5D